MVEPYPPIEPHETGKLDVGDGQSIYWEVSGNPSGKPAVALHGGPGSGLTAGRRRWFDPERYRLVQLDQRGCGRSTPDAGDWSTDLSANTTHHLIADLERLREHLGIERWLVWGASWGVTLALAYAERFPERVSEMILLSITMTRRRDVRWFSHETGRFFPDEWQRFRAGVPEADRDGDLVAAYDRLLNGGTEPVSRRLQAARDWVAWEDAVLSLEEGYVSPHPRWSDERVHDRVRPARDALLLPRGVARGGRAPPQRRSPGRDPGRPAPRPPRPVRTAGRGLAAGAGVARLGAALHRGRTHRRRGDGPAAA